LSPHALLPSVRHKLSFGPNCSHALPPDWRTCRIRDQTASNCGCLHSALQGRETARRSCRFCVWAPARSRQEIEALCWKTSVVLSRKSTAGGMREHDFTDLLLLKRIVHHRRDRPACNVETRSLCAKAAVTYAEIHTTPVPRLCNAGPQRRTTFAQSPTRRRTSTSTRNLPLSPLLPDTAPGISGFRTTPPTKSYLSTLFRLATPTRSRVGGLQAQSRARLFDLPVPVC